MNNKAQTIVLKLPKVPNFRKIYESKDGNGIMYSASCPILDIFGVRKEIDRLLEINPRTQKETSAPSKAMRETLKNAQDMFIFRNRGMTFMAYDATWDNKTNELIITFKIDTSPEGETNGLADGAHTYEVIKDFVEEVDEAERKDITAEVRLDIMIGFEERPEEVMEIVEARNTSTQVKDESLLNSKGVFDPLKEALKGASYANDIAYYENQRIDETDVDSGYRTIKITSVISYLMCFDVTTFSENDHPTQAYSSKRKPLAWYEQKLKDDRPNLIALLALTKDILDLRDYIESQIPRVWNRISGRYADQKGVRKLNNEIELDFSNYTVDYDVPGGHVYPILAAFRALVVKDGNVYKFRRQPKELFDKMNTQNMKSLLYKLRGAKDQDPQTMGKNSDLYDSCYGTLRGYYYELEAGRK